MWTFNPSAYDESVTSLATGPGGEIYVAGQDYSPGNGQWRVAKLSPSGEEEWTLAENPGEWDDAALALATDPQGGIYVAGSVSSASHDSGWRVVKLSPEGTKVWEWNENRTEYRDQALRIDVSVSGEVAVAGILEGQGAWWQVTKLAANGTQLWNWTKGIMGQPGGIAIRQAGDIFVVGSETTLLMEYRWRVQRIGQDGSDGWMRVGEWGLGNGYLSDIMPGAGGVTAAGGGFGPARTDWGIYRFDLNGTTIDEWSHHPPMGHGAARLLAPDWEDGVLLAGWESQRNSSDSQWRVVSFHSDGTPRWNWTSNPGAGWDSPSGMSRVSDQRLILGGSDSGAGNSGWRVVSLKTRDDQPPLVTHWAPKSVMEARELRVEATATDDTGVAEVTLHYKSAGDVSFLPVPMDKESPGNYSATIPANRVLAPRLLFYVEAKDAWENRAFSPALGFSGPDVVEVTQESVPPEQNADWKNEEILRSILPVSALAVLLVMLMVWIMLRRKVRLRAGKRGGNPLGKRDGGRPAQGTVEKQASCQASRPK